MTARRPPWRGSESLLSRWIRRVEDLIYAAVGLLLAAVAVTLLVWAVPTFFSDMSGDMRTAVTHVMDSLLLAFMLVEILHTVGISLRDHELVTEPFLIIGLIAGVRRILVITAEQKLGQTPDNVFQMALVELGLLTLMVLAFVFAIRMTRHPRAEHGEADLAEAVHSEE